MIHRSISTPRFLVATGLLLAATFSVRAGAPSIAPPARIDASRLDSPWARFADGVAVPFDAAAQSALVPALAGNTLAAKSLAAVDLDGDAVEELVAGYEHQGRGRLTVWSGTLESRRPKGAEARLRRVRGQFDVPPFRPTSTVVEIDLVPDFLVAGDFDRDDKADILVGQLGKEELLWLSGDGHGGFGEPHHLPLPGRLTALASGDVNRRDGLVDLVAAVDGDSGPALLVFESPAGAVAAEPERIPLDAPATAVTVAWLSNDSLPGIAAVAGRELVLVPGRDRQLFRDPEYRTLPDPLRTIRVPLAGDPVDVAIGNFVLTDEHAPVAAVLEADGTAEFLAIPALSPRKGEPVAAEALAPAERLRTLALTPSATARFAPATVTSLPAQDLVVFDRASARLELLPGDAAAWRARRIAEGENLPDYPDSSRPLPISTDAPVAALLPLRLGLTSLHDLVVLPAATRASSPAPVVVPSSVANTYSVTNVNLSGAGSFFQAITNANNHAGSDYISFAIPVGAATIPIISTGTYPLPTVTENVTIDASTQPAGWVGVDGSGALSPSWMALNAHCNGGSIYNLVTGNWATRAIQIYEFGNWFVRGCRIGTNTAGTAAAPNGSYGLDCDNWSMADTITVGGLLAGDGNLISGNTEVGVTLSPGDVAQGNYIGTNAAGTSALANGLMGIQAYGYASIGATLSSARNVISGNATGIYLGVYNVVQGNYIGLNAAGSAKVANVDGMETYGRANTIGGTSAGARNIISGNSYGIHLHDTSDNTGSGAQNLVTGNYIGPNPAGTASLGNYYDGIFVEREWNSTIGGTTSGAGNVISGNTLWGIQLTQLQAGYNTQALIQGNYIGTNAAGSGALANGSNGILCNLAGGNTIGGTSTAARNVISGNSSTGLRLYQSSNNTVQGNFIGVNSGGVTLLGNGGQGIEIYIGTNNTIGGTLSGVANTISGNTSHGIRIWGAGSDLNVVKGNYIGLDYTAAQDKGNGGSGLSVEGATNTTIGGSSFNEWNIISGNTSTGITVSGAGATGTWIYGNRIGTNAFGTAAVGNGSDAIRVDGAPTVRIGSSASGNQPLLSGNLGNGVYVINGGTALVKNCRIGTDYSGNSAIPNINGIVINSSPSCAIGGVRTSSEGNQISGNSNIGIYVTGAASTNTTIFGNDIGVSASGGALPNGSVGVYNAGSPAVKIGDINTSYTQNVISGNGSTGVLIAGTGASGSSVETNAIGTNAAGTAAIPNGGDGVQISGASNCVVGGVIAGNNTNIISGNVGNGISIVGAGATNNEVTNNYIGTGWQGSPALGNSGDGIYIQDATGNSIGSATNGGVNTIGTNHRHGIELAGAASGNFIRHNAIGVPWFLDNTNIGNLLDGIHFGGTASNNYVGGLGSQEPNSIWNNGGAGIAVAGGTGNNCRANDFRGNGGLAIDLGPTGPTANDALDADTGANNLQNFPVVTNYAWSNNQTVITGTLDSKPNTTYHVDLYRDTTGDGTWTEWVNEAPVTTDGSGHATFIFTASWVLLSPTLTATDPSGNTSETSRYPTGSTVGEVSPGGDLKVTKFSSSLVHVTFTAATCGPTSNVAYVGTGPINGAVSWVRSVCGLSTYLPVNFDPGAPDASGLVYFLLVAEDGVREGSYGKDSSAQQIPQAVGVGACDLPQTLASSCI